MTQPVFVRTREIYHSYRDFFKLVEVSGYKTCFVDQMNMHDPNACYIVTYLNDEWRHATGKARVIHWNMEWFEDTEHHAYKPGITERWTSDKSHADESGMLYVPIGSDYNLCDGDYVTDHLVYDVALISCMSERRVKIYHDLLRMGVRIAPNYHAHEGRHKILMQSRMVLHIHQTQRKVISPLRMAVAAAYGLPVISEGCDDPGIYEGCIHFVEYDKMVSEVMDVLIGRNPDVLIQGLQKRLCEEYTFRKCVDTALLGIAV